MSRISFSHVTKAYPNAVGVRDVSFRIERGEFVYLTGSSGAGKSTLLHLLTKYIEPDHGNIRVGELDFSRLSTDEIPYLRRIFGIVSAEVPLMPKRTVAENVRYPLYIQGITGKKAREKRDTMLGLMGIKHIAHKRADSISGGERARAMLARALITAPQILIADEPTAALSRDQAWDIVQLLEHFNHQGLTILMATHHKSLVNLTRKRVLYLKNGKLVSDEHAGRYHSSHIPVDWEKESSEWETK